MPLTPNSITVDPTGHSTAVTVTNAYGDNATVYSSSNGSSAVSFPDTITTTTTYYVPGSGGSFTVSGTVSDVEVGPAKVEARYGVPQFVRFPVDDDVLIGTGGNGGSVAGLLRVVSSQSNFASNDTPVTVPLDGASTLCRLITATPPDWLDTAGNIIAPGMYLVDVIVSSGVAPTTPGLFGLIAGIDSADDIVSFDAVAAFPGRPFSLATETFTLTEDDLPFAASARLYVPTDATGTVTLSCAGNQVGTITT